MQDLDSVIKKLRGLTQYQKLSEEELIKLAKNKQKEWDRDLDIESMFVDKKEKKLAKELLRRYLKDYSIETISDKNMLKQLIFLEIVNVRLQGILNKMQQNAKGNVVNLSILDGIHKNINEITALKEKLNLIGSQETIDAYKIIDTLKRKFKKWREMNQGSRSLICPHCGKMVLLKIRTDKYDAVKFPFFEDRILTSKAMLDDYKAGLITKEQIARYLHTSVDYIDWILKKHYKKEEIKKADTEVKEQ